ncbi:hypothetical protein [Yeosuana sp. AK3]
MDLNVKGILISVFQLAEKGELSKIEQKKIVEALFSYGNSIDPKLLDEKFKLIRIGSRTLLEQTENCIDSALAILKEFHQNIGEMKIDIQSMPEGAIYGDDKETLKFINSLNKDVYNFSEASKLINISRQTIKAHADSEKYSLKTFIIGKSQYISKKSLIDYYRAYFNKNGFNF